MIGSDIDFVVQHFALQTLRHYSWLGSQTVLLNLTAWQKDQPDKRLQLKLYIENVALIAPFEPAPLHCNAAAEQNAAAEPAMKLRRIRGADFLAPFLQRLLERKAHYYALQLYDGEHALTTAFKDAFLLDFHYLPPKA
jgi:hypothetical protein